MNFQITIHHTHHSARAASDRSATTIPKRRQIPRRTRTDAGAGARSGQSRNHGLLGPLPGLSNRVRRDSNADHVRQRASGAGQERRVQPK